MNTITTPAIETTDNNTLHNSGDPICDRYSLEDLTLMLHNDLVENGAQEIIIRTESKNDAWSVSEMDELLDKYESFVNNVNNMTALLIEGGVSSSHPFMMKHLERKEVIDNLFLKAVTLTYY